jgi:hypothetical protein
MRTICATAQEDQKQHKKTKADLGAILKKARDVSAHRHKERQKRIWKGSRNSTRTICATAQEDQKQPKKTKADLGAIIKHKERQARESICALAQRTPKSGLGKVRATL